MTVKIFHDRTPRKYGAGPGSNSRPHDQRSNSRPHDQHSDSLLALLRSAVAGRIYKHHSKHTSNSGFDRSFIPCSGYILFAAEQRVGYQISWVDLQREVNCP